MTIVIVPVLLFTVLIAILYWKQDAIVQELLSNFNEDFKGRIEIKDSHISPFANFPYISIDLEDVRIYENKTDKSNPIVDAKDMYLGFDLWTILSGKMEIKKLKLHKGKLNLVQHKDGELNVVKALSSVKPVESPEEEFHLDLNSIELQEVDLTKYNEISHMLVESYITKTKSTFKTSPSHLKITVDSRFMLNVLVNGDTTFVKHKHFEVATELDFNKKSQILTVKPTTAKLEGAEFNLSGKVDFKNDAYVDFTFNGTKPDFKLFIAMAPEELIPVLKLYDNKGDIQFDARIVGKTANGQKPFIKANFKCKEGYFNNTTVQRKLDNLGFKAYFSNGSKRDLSTCEFRMENFTARPEAGTFTGDVYVKNFESPEINFKLKSNFKLDFLAKFFNVKGLQNLDGNIKLTMNFKDIIDLNHPERSIQRLNESYFTQLKVENLRFKSTAYRLPVKDIDMYAEMRGHEARIEYFKIKVGQSDFNLSAIISDLPAILHHTDTPVKTDMSIKCRTLDLFELTGGDSSIAVQEKIKKLSLDLSFISSAKAISESKTLPVGEFFIKNFYAKLQHYPHTLHDFHADVIIDDKNLKLKDLKGQIDKSDFLFTGSVSNYDLWFGKQKAGDTKVEYNLKSTMLQLADIFSYKGENYVPEDYRHEEFDNLNVHGYCDLHFNHGFKSMDMRLDKLTAKMKVHPLRFENFNGRIHYESEHLMVENFSGKMGHSDFKTTLHYYLGKDEAIRKRDNHFELHANRLDLDQLLAYTANPGTATTTVTNINHDAGFNIYELPFTNMTFKINIAHMNYHRYLLNHVKSNFRTTKNHYIYFDDLHIDAAGGSFDITGYFNGSDPHKIYFSPKMQIKHVDLDKLLFKFDNFGQDHVVSENLHGKLNATVTGKIHMHNDLVPKLDDSEMHMDIEVLNGRLENYKMLEYVGDYFADKNLKKVLFDTLRNHIDLTNGTLTIPNMTINTSLGFMQISGKQDMQLNMMYYIRVPWKMVTKAAASKLFGKNIDEVDPDQIDAIQYADKNKKIRYLNIKIKGNAETYDISLDKEKHK